MVVFKRRPNAEKTGFTSLQKVKGFFFFLEGKEMREGNLRKIMGNGTVAF